MALNQDPAVTVKNAYKYYGSKKDPNKKIVLNHLDMTVEKGSIYGLLGSSGCGKTTLLSCVVGRRSLMSGSIKVLSGAPATAIAPRIGYMPQEVALVSEFTVKNAIYFFGRIYGLNDTKIDERFSFLKDLLELPDENRAIKNCSGGQQRRVSFAAALVHEPELLILDEPTVGLDPVLRDKIWNHLVHLALGKNTAVVITTHYIEEARQAQRIGLMRGGKLLAEESPDELMNRFNCETLEEAFLTLSIKQSKTEGGVEEPIIVESNDDPTSVEAVNSVYDNSTTNHYDSKDDFSKIHAGSTDVLTNEKAKEKEEKSSKLAYLKGKKAQALFIKNVQQFSRHPGGLIFSLLFPFLQLLSFFTAVGHDPRELTIAIMNDEVPYWQDCLNNTSPTAIYDPENYSCKFEKLSCRYIDSIDNSIIIKEFYQTLDEAKESVRRGKAIAALYIARNFSNANQERQENGRDVDEGSVDSSIAYYWVDMSNHQLAYYLKTKLYKDYVNFSKSVFSDCGSSPRLADIPITFADPLYGSIDSSFVHFMVPGVMMTILFFLATTVTSTVIITDRLEGVWDRTIVAGVESGEILTVHVLLQTFVIIVQTIEIMMIGFLLYGVPFIGDLFNISFILFLQGIAGMCFGFLVSVLCDTYTLAFFVSTGSFYPMIMLCGIIWPIEGMATGIKYFSLALPFTIPVIAMRNIIEKGASLGDPIIIYGYLVTIAWIVGLLALCYVLIRFRRK